ncbi:MAG: YifB family Mg chelatase-like AAA ATPase [Alphaproteobacteria bacterium]
MVTKVTTVAFQGMAPVNITVESAIVSGLPNFSIVGLPDKSVSESRERIRSCFYHLGVNFPAKRVTVNLAPADQQKEGSHYDLPIALTLMASMDLIDGDQLFEYLALGELSLDGNIIFVPGVLAASIHAQSKNLKLICPKAAEQEALWSGHESIVAAPNLLSIINHFKGTQVITSSCIREIQRDANYSVDMSDVKGQRTAKRACEIAAAGGHHFLMIGPPGAGKSMLAQRLPTILPLLSAKEALEVTIIYSLARMLPKQGLIHKRPFRDPHHSSSLVSLVGGGTRAKPGEISLANYGVLFLDELPEFSRATLEALRQPLESGAILVSRAHYHVTYPAKIQLVCAMNPCRCGYYGDPKRQCHRAPRCVKEYQSKLSGPLLDRFDMTFFVPPLEPQSFLSDTQAETSESIKKRVEKARTFQEKRYNDTCITNASITPKTIQEMIKLDSESKKILENVIEKWNLSTRGYHRILRVSRTIADLDSSVEIRSSHIKEALQYRKEQIICDS